MNQEAHALPPTATGRKDGVRMSTREQPGDPVLPRRQLAAEQERLRRLQLGQASLDQHRQARPRDRRTTARKGAEEELSNEEEYHGVWPPRLPSSTTA